MSPRPLAAVALSALAAARTGTAAPARVTVAEADLVRRFAEERFAAGDWYRAATEFLRAASYDAAAPDAPELSFKAALCAYRAGRFREARGQLLDLAGAASATELKDRCRYMAAASDFRLGDYAGAAAECAEARSKSPGSSLADRLAYLEGLGALFGDRWAEARAAWTLVPAGSPLAASAGSLSALADRGARLPRRSPAGMAVLSALMPGLGQVACGDGWDGLSALLLNAAGVALVVRGVERDHPTNLWTGVGLLAIFYPANIHGGARAADRFNDRQRSRLLAEASAASALSLE